jgi:N-acetylneuraminic acid mutarotase
MPRPTSFDPTLILGVLILAACGENTIPTQPETTRSPDAATPSVDQPELLSSGLGAWTTRAPMPTARYNLAGNVVYNSSGQPFLYAIGGYDAENTVLRQVEAYNVVTNTWSRKASLPHPRSRTNGAAVIAGKIYVSGGVSSSGGATNSLYVYDPGTNAWTTRASIPVTGFDGVSAAINGKLYVLVANCPTCSRLYRYDPINNTWTRKADCPQQHGRGAASVIDGKLYIVDGGVGSASEGGLDVYDPVTNTWTTKSTGGSLDGPAAAVLAKKLYVLGGFLLDASGEEGELSFQMFAYDPATNTRAEKAHMNVARDGFVARTVSYGGVSYILAVGGSTESGVTGSLERYTP